MTFKLLTLAAIFAIAAPGPTSPDPLTTWPGFRGHNLSGVSPATKVPERWSQKENVKWVAPIAGNGWSSPIVWNDTVYVTSAIGKRAFKQPSPGLYGNDYIAELLQQGLSNEEMMKRVKARDSELPEESDELRYMLYALDVKTGKVKWEREAIRTLPFGGRHRKNTYASETPFTDGERIYVSFGQNVGLFCYSMDGTLLWKKQWTQQPIYLDFGTASSPVVHDGRVVLLHDNEKSSYITALDVKTGAELWTTPRAAGRVELLMDDAVRLEASPADRDRHDRSWADRLLRSRGEGAVARRRHVAVDSVAERLERDALCRNRFTGRRQPAVPGDQARGNRRHLAEARHDSQ